MRSSSRPGVSPAEADAVTADYGDAQLEALKKAMLAVALLALLSLVFTRRLPGTPSGREARGRSDRGAAEPPTARAAVPLARWTRSSSTGSRRPTGRTSARSTG